MNEIDEQEYKLKRKHLEAQYDKYLEMHRNGSLSEVIVADSALRVIEKKIERLDKEFNMLQNAFIKGFNLLH